MTTLTPKGKRPDPHGSFMGWLWDQMCRVATFAEVCEFFHKAKACDKRKREALPKSHAASYLSLSYIYKLIQGGYQKAKVFHVEHTSDLLTRPSQAGMSRRHAVGCCRRTGRGRS